MLFSANERSKEKPGKDLDAMTAKDALAVGALQGLGGGFGLSRSGSDTVWAGPVKQAIRRRQPQFDERFYGFSNFSVLLEAAASRGLMKLEKNENGYRIKVSTTDE